jgi:hypothetical protein
MEGKAGGPHSLKEIRGDDITLNRRVYYENDPEDWLNRYE